MKRKKPASRKLAVQMTKPAPGAVVTVQNVNVPGYTSGVNAAKYVAMRGALLRVLPRRAPGVTQTEMFEAVMEHLPEDLFPNGAKANWWAKTVQLDLEAKGIVQRSTQVKPLRWYRVK
jgi:hypothetical protein